MSRKCISKREIEEEDKEDDYSDSNSSSDDKGNDADQDEAVENMEIYKMECSKSRDITETRPLKNVAREKWGTH